MTKIPKYPFIIRKLSKEEGGGLLIEFPDLPGCMSDGETLEEAIAHGSDAEKCWLAAAKESGRHIPKPGEMNLVSGKWVQRVPKSLHRALSQRAKFEGVSLNTLATTFLAEGLGRHEVTPVTVQH